MIRQFPSYFLKAIRQLVKDDTVRRDDVSYLLSMSNVTQYADKTLNVDDVWNAIKYNPGPIISTWKRLRQSRDIEKYSARKSADSARAAINKQVPAPLLHRDDDKKTKETTIEEPDAYMPDADMDKVSQQCLKDQDVFYDHNDVPKDRKALESLIKKYGKDDILRYIDLAEASKQKD